MPSHTPSERRKNTRRATRKINPIKKKVRKKGAK